MSTLPDALWSAIPFDAFDAEARAALAAASDVVEVSDGDAVYLAGDTATGLYVLLEGAVRLVDPLLSSFAGDASEAGERFEDAGTIISKGSVLEPFEHRHHLYAAGNARLLTLSRAAFEELFDKGSPVAFRLLDFLVRNISADVRGLNRAIQELLAES